MYIPLLYFKIKDLLVKSQIKLEHYIGMYTIWEACYYGQYDQKYDLSRAFSRLNILSFLRFNPIKEFLCLEFPGLHSSEGGAEDLKNKIKLKIKLKKKLCTIANSVMKI